MARRQGKSAGSQRANKFGDGPGPQHTAIDDHMIGTQHVVPVHQVSHDNPAKVVQPKDVGYSEKRPRKVKGVQKVMQEHLQKLNAGLKTY